MRTPQRHLGTGVIGRLFAEPWRFGFGQAVRLLVQWLGRGGVPYDEALAHVLRFENSLALGFPASEVEAVRGEEHDGVAGIVVTPACIGLLGTAGTLPLHYTDRVAHIAGHEGAAWLDVYSRRMVTLFWQTGYHHRVEHTLDTGRHDAWCPQLLALAARDDGHGDAAAWYSGLLGARATSAAALENIVAGHLGLPVRLESLAGCWDPIPPALRSTLGTANPVLGSGATLGKRVWVLDRRVRLVIGPLARGDFERLLPGGEGAAMLARLLDMAVRPGMLEFEVCLLPGPSCIRPLTLTGKRAAMVRLGWDSILPDAADRPAQREIRYLLRPHSQGEYGWPRS